MVGPLAEKLKLGHPHLLTRYSFGALALVLVSAIHFAVARQVISKVFSSIGWVFRTIFWSIPKWVLTRPLVLALWNSKPIQLALRHLVKPAALAGGLFLTLWLLHVPVRVALIACGVLLVGVSVASGFTAVLVAEEILMDFTRRKLRALTHHVLPGLFALIMEVVKKLVEVVERAIYRVDEALRFRPGDSTLSQLGKGILGLVWFFVSFLVRLYVNLLVEPQVNPIKHFPVVTVTHKILIPFYPAVFTALLNLTLPVGKGFATTFASVTVFLLPGIAGFLAWELKENFRLYRASRATDLRPVIIGSHGETMNGLLVPGFHSGTLPKVFSKLRRAVRSNSPVVIKLEHDVEHVAEAIARAFERGMCEILRQSERFADKSLGVLRVELASNRVRVLLALGASTPCVVCFEEQSSLLVASVVELGFIEKLGQESRAAFEDALAGAYAEASVDVIRERVEQALGHARYDLADEGLVVFEQGAHGFDREIVYPLDGGDQLHARDESAPKLPADAVLAKRRPLAYETWSAAWQGRTGSLPEISRSSLLPVR